MIPDAEFLLNQTPALSPPTLTLSSPVYKLHKPLSKLGARVFSLFCPQPRFSSSPQLWAISPPWGSLPCLIPPVSLQLPILLLPQHWCPSPLLCLSLLIFLSESWVCAPSPCTVEMKLPMYRDWLHLLFCGSPLPQCKQCLVPDKVLIDRLSGVEAQP